MSDWEGRLIAVDPEVCEIVHRTETELIGMTFKALTHPDDRFRNVEILRQLAVGAGPVTIEKRYVRPDGEVVWATATVSKFAIRGGGTLVGTITMLPNKTSVNLDANWRAAKGIVEAINDRRQLFGPELFGDFAYLILVALYLADSEGRVETLETLSAVTGTSLMLTMRWVSVLISREYLEFADFEQSVPQLTVNGMMKVEKMLASESINASFRF